MIWNLITGDLLPYLIAGLAALGSIVAAYFKGGQNTKRKFENKDLKADKATNERINNADIGTGDAADDLDWLRRRNESKRRPK